MYAGFNLQINENLVPFFSGDSIERIRDFMGSDLAKVRSELEEYMLPDGNLSGELMQKEWFPNVKADVFISHSHQDENLALQLAGYLYEHFELKSFIDSTVWGYSDDLLFQLNEKLSKRSEGLYDYDQSNYAASHVHMMLSVALNKMMDKCECLFFLNTPNSVTVRQAMNPTTGSAWIFSEIANSRLLKIREPVRRITKLFSGESDKMNFITEAMSIHQPLELDHLYNLGLSDLIHWNVSNVKKGPHALDRLYAQHNIP